MQRIKLSYPREIMCLLIALFLIPMTGAGVDIYVPAIPEITQHFHATTTMVQLTVSLYLIGYAFGQLILGALTDSLGRKWVVLAAIILYTITSYLVTIEDSINGLLYLRLLQGLFVSGFAIGTRTTLSDIAEGMKLKRYLNYMSICWALGPILAPVIGGYLATWYGWQAPFYFLTIYAAVMAIVVLVLLPETHLHKHPFEFKRIASNYHNIITNKVFLASLFILTAGYGVIIIFNVIGPYLVETVLGYSKIDYGHIGLLLGVAVFLGNCANRFLIEYFKPISIINYSIWLFAITSLLMVFAAYIWQLNIWLLLVPAIICFFLSGLFFPNAFTKCISLFQHIAGAASAVLGSSFIFMTAILTAIASLFQANTMQPMSLMYFAIAILCLLSYYLVLRKHFKD